MVSGVDFMKMYCFRGVAARLPRNGLTRKYDPQVGKAFKLFFQN